MKLVLSSLLLTFYSCQGSDLHGPTASFNFNDHALRDKKSGLAAKAYNVSWVEDRFGNPNNACYLQGGPGSFINLGNSSLLKPRIGTISIWLNISHPMLHGRGVESNPIFFTRAHGEEDHNEALYIGYDYMTQNLNINCTLNKEKQLTLYCTKPLTLREWHHLAMTYDNSRLNLYVDGQLEGTIHKTFETSFLRGDSVLVGNRTSTKNERYFNGAIDDIEIYDRVLSSTEIKDLFKAPNPNKNSILVSRIFYISASVFFVLVVAWLIKHRVDVLVKRGREKNQLLYKSLEQEIKILKAQMDPHFIFNSLNTLLQFIVTNENEKAEVYLTKFSRLIRKLLESNTQENISLADEIDILEKYLDIESLRFNEIFHYHIHIDPNINVSKIRIPHMLVQPFIENAIWHGLRLKQGKKELNIFFELIEDGRLLCIIDDNGIGMNHNKNNGTKNQSLAINFIRQRLDLLSKVHNKQYTLNVIEKNKGPEEGTRIEITIPIYKL